MKIILTHRLPANHNAAVAHTLALSAEERTRSRHRFTSIDGVEIQLLLPRGTTLREGDLLGNDEDTLRVQIQARPEPVITAHAADALTLTRAAYHLGNRHVALEFGRAYLRLSPDPVLIELLMQLGLSVVEEVAPFQPEAGAYGNHSHHHDQGIARVPFRQHS